MLGHDTHSAFPGDPGVQQHTHAIGAAIWAKDDLGAHMVPPQPGPPTAEWLNSAPHYALHVAADSSSRHRRRRDGHPVWFTVGAFALTILGVAWYVFPHQLLLMVLLGAGVFNMTVGTLEARWRLHAWRTPEAAESGGWPTAVSPRDAQMTFSLIVAAKDEAEVIADTLRGLIRQNHPHYEILVSLCADDTATVAAAMSVARQYPDLIRVVTDHYDDPSKARQLNTALPFCAGTVVGVIDAEDDVASALLLHVEALLVDSGAHIVQGGVQLMNLGEGPRKWFQVHNVLEYFFWYTSRMSYQADVGFVPLGGNTVFIYRRLLEEIDGWPLSLTEDCALGVRLAADFNVTVATAYSAELCTREEAPPTIFNKELGSLFWQRDRWIRGFIYELIQGTWRRMPGRRQRIFAVYILSTPLLQGLSCLLLPLAIISALTTKAPIGLALFLFSPLIPMGITILTQLIGLRQFGREFGQRVTVWHYASVLFLTPLYQLILMAATTTAAYKCATGDTKWYKTGRASEHRAKRPVAVIRQGATR